MNRFSNLSPRTWITLAFILSRLLYGLAGVRFDTRPLDFYVQFIDPELLRHRLLESLFYLHTQPPGFNLFLGIFLKLFGNAAPLAFQALYLLTGLAIAFLMYELMRKVALPRKLASGLSILFSISPAAILYENHLTYEYPILALLCGAAYSLVSWVETRSPSRMWTFQACLFALMMIRGTFQPLYYVLVVTALAFHFRLHRRFILRTALLPAALILALCVKNLALFGSFSTGAWPGFQAYIMTSHQLSATQREALQSKGVISPLASVEAISQLVKYEPHVKVPGPTGIPVLDEPRKSTGRVNANHLAFRQVQDAHLADARAILWNVPEAPVKAIATAWFTYFLPASDFPFFDANRPKIYVLDRVVNAVFFGQFRDASNRKDLRSQYDSGGIPAVLPYTGVFLLIGLPLLTGWAAQRLWKGWKRRELPLEQAVLMAFLLFNILFVSAVSNLASCYENNRYRFSLDPFFVILLAMAIAETIRSHRKRRTSLSGRSRSIWPHPALSS